MVWFKVWFWVSSFTVSVITNYFLRTTLPIYHYVQSETPNLHVAGTTGAG